MPQNILLAKPRGFCADVERAVEIAERLLNQFGPPIYVKFDNFAGSVNVPCNVMCAQALPDGTSTPHLSQYRGVPSSWTCPGDPNWTRLDASRNCAVMGPPVTCVPVSQSTSGGGGGNNKALIAGGVAIAAVLAVKFLTPDLPEGTSIRPTANVAYRDGFPSASVGLSGEYGPLSFSASSAHTGEKWTKPYAQVRWTWAF